jgi:hypothetical protein
VHGGIAGREIFSRAVLLKVPCEELPRPPALGFSPDLWPESVTAASPNKEHKILRAIAPEGQATEQAECCTNISLIGYGGGRLAQLAAAIQALSCWLACGAISSARCDLSNITA